MGILQSPLGKFRQSIGGVTFSNFKGINVAKAKPTSVSNPKTAAQLKQRAAMAFMVAMSRPINTSLRLFWSKLAIKMSQYNAFVKENLKNLTYVTDHWELPSSDFLLTKGTLFDLGSVSATSSEAAGTIVATLGAAPDTLGYSANVSIYGAAFDKLGNIVAPIANLGAASSLSTASVTIPASSAVETDEIQVFVFAYDDYTRNACDSSTVRITVGA